MPLPDLKILLKKGFEVYKTHVILVALKMGDDR